MPTTSKPSSTPSTPSTPPPPPPPPTRQHSRAKRPRRLLRRIALVCVVLLVALIGVLGLFGPAIASSFAPAFIEDALGSKIAGDIRVDGLSLSWNGPQRAEQITILDIDGSSVGELSIQADAGLLALLTGDRAALIRVGGHSRHPLAPGVGGDATHDEHPTDAHADRADDAIHQATTCAGNTDIPGAHRG